MTTAATAGPHRSGAPGEAPRRRRTAGAGGSALAVAVLLGCVACSGGPPPAPTPAFAPTATAPDDAPLSSSPGPSAPLAGATVPGPVLPAATSTPQDVVTGLTTPWGIAFLPGGAALVTLRDPRQVVLVGAAGVTTLTGPGADALMGTTVAEGEGGLLGIAVAPDDPATVVLYRTTAEGNEVVRAPLDAIAGTLGALQPVLTGIPAARNHNGGRIAFGPDGLLYVATGDAGRTDSAQDPSSLAGKILRVTAEGAPAPGNPVPGSPVWTLGHRNVQGLAWDAAGRMYASEFGQDTYDELNVVTAGGNYGWPVVEGPAGDTDFVRPLVTWPTDQASPSGIATAGGQVHLAALRGSRLWTVTPGADPEGGPEATATATLEGELGRLRDVVAGPDGALWLLTQNTDGRGEPRPGDDRLVRVAPPAG